jgi:hypothetical protein
MNQEEQAAEALGMTVADYRNVMAQIEADMKARRNGGYKEYSPADDLP